MAKPKSSTTQPRQLSATEITVISGGINPQPLPPGRYIPK